MKNTQDILYFDGRCGQCAAEMKYLNRWKNRSLTLVDIHDIESDIVDIDRNEMLSILHLKTAQGLWIKGLDANVRAWSHTGIGWLFLPLRWPLIRSIADFIYYRWANKRACRLGYKTT